MEIFMKKLLCLVLLLLVMFCGCLNVLPSFGFADEYQWDDNQAEGQGKIYLYSEISPYFGPGPFSVNSLAEIYGAPQMAYGTLISAASGQIGIRVFFGDVDFELTADYRDDRLSFSYEDVLDGPDDGGDYRMPLEISDERTLLYPSRTTITGNSQALPRGIQIGCDRQTVVYAYDGDMGEAWESEGRLLVSYAYSPDGTNNNPGKTGDIVFYFQNDQLFQATISWYNIYLAFD